MRRKLDEAIDFIEARKNVVPPVITVLAMIGMGRLARLATLGMGVAWAAKELRALDRSRTLDAPRRKAERAIDRTVEDSFPASDPASYSSSTAGAPDEGNFNVERPANSN